MSLQMKRILFAMCILALLVSACDLDLRRSGSVDSKQSEQDIGAEEEVSDVDPEEIPDEEERNETLEGVNRGGPVAPGQGEDNQSGGTGHQNAPSAGTSNPTPGPEGSDATQVESEQAEQPAPVEEEVSSEPPEDAPSEEERSDRLEGVNRGGPVAPEGENAEPVDGPAPGTESTTGGQ
jgi:hypothetical protein